MVGRSLWRPLETSLLWRENQQPCPSFSLLQCGAGRAGKGGSLLPGAVLHEVRLPQEKGQVLKVWRTDLIEETLQWKPELQNGVQTMGRDLGKVQVQRQLADRQRKKVRWEAMANGGREGWGVSQKASGKQERRLLAKRRLSIFSLFLASTLCMFNASMLERERSAFSGSLGTGCHLKKQCSV